MKRRLRPGLTIGRPSTRRILIAVIVVLPTLCALVVYWMPSREPSPSATSLLLLPFTDTPGSAGEYLGAGLSATLAHQLGELPDIEVPTPALWSYVDPELGSRRLATRLGYERILHGELARNDGTVDLSLRIFRADESRRGGNIGVSRSIESMIDLQIQLLTTVARELGKPLDSTELNRARRALSRSNKAYDDYLRAIDYLADTAHPRGPRFAIELLRRATRLDPQFALAWLTLGRAEWRAGIISGGETKETLDAALRSIAIGEQRLGGSRFGAVGRLLVQKSLDPGLDCAQATRRWGSRNFRSSIQMMDMAANYFQVGALLTAEDCLQAAVETDRYDLQAWSRWGDFLWRTGRLFEARDVYSEARSVVGSQAPAPARSLSLLQLHSEEYARAIATFEGAGGTVLDPLHATDLASAYLAIGESVQAERLARIAVSDAPGQPRLHEVLADLLVRRGKTEEAREEYRVALMLFQQNHALASTNSQLDLRETVLLAKAGDCDQAIPRAMSYRRHRQLRADSSLDLARAFAICEQEDLARQSLERGLELGFPRPELDDDPLLQDLLPPSSPAPSVDGVSAGIDGG